MKNRPKTTTRMSLSFGIFKGSYKGHGLYWNKHGYNVEGQTSFPTLGAAKAAVDKHEIDQQKKEDALKAQHIVEGKCILAHKNSDGSVTITIPGIETREYRDIDQARKVVFKLEEEFDKELVWV